MLIFVDLELSSLESRSVICSIGLIIVKDGKITRHYELINEGEKITPEASALHHITNEMIVGVSSFKESLSYRFLQEEGAIIILHNTKSEFSKLVEAGLSLEKVVDTARVSKHLIPESEIFYLQYLRYELRLYRDEKSEALLCGIEDALIAHHALSDALIVKLLYNYLLSLATLEEMQKLSFKEVLLEKFSFGKYKGRYIEEIAMSDRGYLMWMLALEDLDEDVRYSIEYYLEG